MNKKILTIHQKLNYFFFKFSKNVLSVLPWLLGFASFWIPVILIWMGIIDKNLTFIKVTLYTIGGICGFYFSGAFNKIYKLLDKKEKN